MVEKSVELLDEYSYKHGLEKRLSSHNLQVQLRAHTGALMDARSVGLPLSSYGDAAVCAWLLQEASCVSGYN